MAARLTPDGEMLVAIEVGVGDEDRVQSWRRQNDEWEEYWKSGHAAPRNPDNHPRDIVFSTDGTMFLALPSNTIFDAKNGRELAQLYDRDRYELMCAEFSPDGKRLATGSYFGVARIWNVIKRSPLPTKTISTESVTDFELSQNGDRLALFTEAGGIVILDSQTFNPGFKFPPKENYRVSEHALGPDGKRLAVIFDVAEGQSGEHTPAAVVVTAKPGEEAIIEPLNAEITFSAEPKDEESSGKVSGEAIADIFRWNADSSKLAVTSSKVVSVCSFPSGNTRVYRQQKPDFFHAAQFNAAGTHLYIFDRKGVLVWDLSSQTDPVRLIESENDKGVLSPDGKTITLATAGEGGALSFWDAQTGKRIGQPTITWTGVKSEITSVAYSADSARVVATTWQGGFRILDPASGRPITDKIDTQRLFSGAFIGKDRLLLTTGKLEVELWNSDGKRLAGAIHTSGSKPEARITNDGKNLLFADDDGQIVMKAMPGQFSDAPEWLPDLAEAVCGWRVNDAGILESIEETQPEKLQQVCDRIRASPEGSPLKDWAMTTIRPLAGAYEPSKNSSQQQHAVADKGVP
jgi:WD40 repeat protein